jgi:hypothetical protein
MTPYAVVRAVEATTDTPCPQQTYQGASDLQMFMQGRAAHALHLSFDRWGRITDHGNLEAIMNVGQKWLGGGWTDMPAYGDMKLVLAFISLVAAAAVE